MSTLSLTHSVVDAIVADLEAADWQYDPAADDMDIILPDVTNRAADWVQVDDDGCFVRIDLSIDCALSGWRRSRSPCPESPLITLRRGRLLPRRCERARTLPPPSARSLSPLPAPSGLCGQRVEPPIPF